MTDAPAPPEGRRVIGSAVVTAAMQLGSMGIGALLAIVILHQFGKTPSTDGLFAAYGVYGLLIVVAQTFRTTTVPRLAETGDVDAAFDRYLGAVVVLWLASGVLLLALAGPLAALLTASLAPEAEEAASSSLRIFWLAAGGQLVAALGAAALAVRGSFALPGGAFVLGGTVGIVLTVLLADSAGPDAVAIGVAAGSALTAAVVLGGLLARGWRPRPARLRPRGATARSLGLMLLGAVASISAQVCYVVSLAFAARIAPGAVTDYSYAFFAAVLLIGVTSASAGIVMIAAIAEDWDRDPRSLFREIVDVQRAGMTLIVPALALAALVGDEVVALVLGDAISATDADRITGAFVVLGGAVVGALSTTVPLLAATTEGAYARIAGAALISLVVHVAASAAAAALGSLAWLAAAAVLSGVSYVFLIVRLVYGRRWGAPLRLLATETGRYALLGIVAFCPLGLLAVQLGGVGWELAAFAAGLGVFLALLRASSGPWDVACRMADPVTGLVRARRAVQRPPAAAR